MKKVTVSDPIIIAQSTTEPILFGGYQDPFIRVADDKTIYVRFNARRDCPETFGLEEANPVLKSTDGGVTWEKETDPKAYSKAIKTLPNGDKLQMREWKPILNIDDETIEKFPKIPESRKNNKWIGEFDVYTVDEMLPIFGKGVAKEFPCNRIYAGTDEVVEEICKVNWDKMPLQFFNRTILRTYCSCPYDVDKNGTLWMPVMTSYVDENGEAPCRLGSTHLLRSDDFGHTWDYVNSVVYDEEKYNKPNMIDIEGFGECALTCLDDGSIIMVMRSGSLYPFEPKIGDKDHPAPYAYIAKTSDGGKTFDFVKPFYDYGIRPWSVKLGCGTIVLISGRPGVYIRTCDDPKGEEWDDVIQILEVPEDEVYTGYWEYSCSNCCVAAYDDNTAFIVYSDFQQKTPDGERAKSIIVRKITIE